MAIGNSQVETPEKSNRMEGHVSVGHPVDVASGIFYTSAHDVVLPGLMPLIWRRFYSTALLQYQDSTLGPGWLHGFDQWLERTTFGFLLFADDGAQIAFHDPQHTTDDGRIICNAAASMDIRREGDRYAICRWGNCGENCGQQCAGDIHKLMFLAAANPGRMRLDSVENLRGHALRLSWDQHQLTRVTQSVEGKGIRIGYDSEGRISTVTAFAPGNVSQVHTNYKYSPAGRLVVATDALDNDQVYAYDDRGSMIQETAHGGGTFLMRYDNHGRCFEVSGQNRHQHRHLDFDSEHNVTRVTDSLQHITAYRFNARGQVMTIRHPDGGIVRRSFDNEHRIAEQVDTLGRLTRHEYDLRGNRIATTTEGRTTSWTFDNRHQILSATNPGGAQWTFRRSPTSLDSIIYPDGTQTRFVYDSRGILMEQISPLGESIRIEHAADWSTETYRDDIGLILRRYLDPWQRVIREEDARGLRGGFEYDALDRPIRRYENLNAAWTYRYDPNSNRVEMRNPAGHSVLQAYTPHGKLLRFTDANEFAHSFEYDTEGHCTTVINPKGEQAHTEHDVMGRVTRETGFDGRVTGWQYDLGGRVIRKRKPGGQTLDFEYNDRDQLLAIRTAGRTLVRRSYDECGNLVKAESGTSTVEAEWDIAGRLMAEIQNGRRVTYTRNAIGGLRGLELEGGLGAMEFDLDRRGRLQGMRTAGALQQSFSYDAADALTARAMGPAVELLGYDERRRLVDQEVSGEDGSTIFRQSFSYDRAGNLASIGDITKGTRTFRYDAGKRLVESKQAGNEREFVYDDCGNLQSRPGAEFAFAAGSELSAVGSARVEYNAAGLPVTLEVGGRETSFVWDDLDQLIEIRNDELTIANYEYDALGRRIRKITASEGEAHFHWAGDHLLAETALAEGDITMYWTPSLVPALSWNAMSGIQHYVVGQSDVPSATLDTNGIITGIAENDEWGADASGSPTATFRLAGQYMDRESGLSYNRFRYYWPFAGRFLSPDPLGPAGGPNPFVFAPNAMGFADPLGLTYGDVGISRKSPQERCRQYKIQPDQDFDYLEIIFNSGSASNNGLARNEARGLEGSANYSIKAGIHRGNTLSPLQNERRLDDGYSHGFGSNDPRHRGLDANMIATYLKRTVIGES